MADFETALTGMKNKERWRRKGWHPKIGHLWLYDGNILRGTKKDAEYWEPGVSDILLGDWERVEEGEPKTDWLSDSRLVRLTESAQFRTGDTDGTERDAAMSLVGEFIHLRKRVAALEAKNDG